MRTVIIAAAIGLVTSDFTQAGVVADGDFLSWGFGYVGNGVASMTREASSGNPGARLKVTTITGAGQVAHGTGFKSDYSTTTALAGQAFTLSLDVLSGPGSFGSGQYYSLLVEQNGSIYSYGLFVAVTGYPRNFDTVTLPGTFVETSFSLISGPGPANPEFDGGTATRFGFAAGNSFSGTLTQYYDNFRLDSAPLDNVPEPATTCLVGFAVVFLLSPRSRRRAGRETYRCIP
jgi:hypothetical protein